MVRSPMYRIAGISSPVRKKTGTLFNVKMGEDTLNKPVVNLYHTLWDSQKYNIIVMRVNFKIQVLKTERIYSPFIEMSLSLLFVDSIIFIVN